MGLFDVLKYPISDIYDDSQMRILPREIWFPWLQDWYSTVEPLQPPLNLLPSAPAATWIHMLIIRKVGSDVKFERTLKAIITNDLLTRIKEYDPDE